MSYISIRYNPPSREPVCSIPAHHRELIVMDIARPVPIGPKDVLSKYSDDAKYPPAHLCGYDPIVLFRLGIRDKDDMRRHLINLLYGGKTEEQLGEENKTGSVTRYTNRAWKIVRSAILSVKSVGSYGLYEIYETSYKPLQYSVVGYVHANDMKSAEIVGSTLFGFLVPEGTFRARYVEWCSPADIDVENVRLMASISDHVDYLTDKEKELRSRILFHNAQIEALGNVLDEDKN